MAVHALIILAHLIVSFSLKVLHYELIQKLSIAFVSYSSGCETFIDVEAVGGVAVRCEFLSYSPQQGRVGRGVQVGAETGTSRVQATSARGLKGEGCGA